MPNANGCVMCGALITTRWTVDSGEKISVADLCAEHEMPLRQILLMAGDKPPARPVPMTIKPPRSTERTRPPKPLEWGPPTPAPLAKTYVEKHEEAMESMTSIERAEYRKRVPEAALGYAGELLKQVPLAATNGEIDVTV